MLNLVTNQVPWWLREVITTAITEARKLLEGVKVDDMSNGYSKSIATHSWDSQVSQQCVAIDFVLTMIISGKAKSRQCKSRLLQLLVCQPRHEPEKWLPAAYFVKEGNPSLAKQPLDFNRGLAKLWIAFLVNTSQWCHTYQQGMFYWKLYIQIQRNPKTLYIAITWCQTSL